MCVGSVAIQTSVSHPISEANQGFYRQSQSRAANYDSDLWTTSNAQLSRLALLLAMSGRVVNWRMLGNDLERSLEAFPRVGDELDIVGIERRLVGFHWRSDQYQTFWQIALWETFTPSYSQYAIEPVQLSTRQTPAH